MKLTKSDRSCAAAALYYVGAELPDEYARIVCNAIERNRAGLGWLPPDQEVDTVRRKRDTA